jgi:hypothetical protein
MVMENSTNELLKYYKSIPFHDVEGIDSVVLILNNEVFLKLEESLEVMADRIGESLPNTKVHASRGISRVRIDEDNNSTLRLFHCGGLSFNDGTKFLMAPFGKNGLEIILLRIAKEKQGIGLDEVMMDLIIAELLVQLLYVPQLAIRFKDEPSKKTIEFFKKYDFIMDDKCKSGERIIIKEQEQLY